jgi:MerR family copper efflux transcriptional regulator
MTRYPRQRLIYCARELGFSIKRIRDVRRLWIALKQSSREVKKLASQHIANLEAQISRMQGLHDTLKHLADACDGDNRPRCPILRDLGGVNE